MTTNTNAAPAAPINTPAARPAVRVSLCGRHARGRSFIIDRDDFDAISATCGSHWTVTADRYGGYVYSSRADALQGAGETAKGNAVSLGRLIGRRIAGNEVKVVVYRNGNRLDLRRNNLSFDRADAAHRVARPAVTVEPYVEEDAA